MSIGGSTENRFTREREEETNTRQAQGSKTEQLVIQQQGIDKLLKDLLSQTGGLKDIFAGEKTAGIFDSSVAAQASGDLAASIVGEISKLTGKKETLTKEEEEKARLLKRSEDEFILKTEGEGKIA